jgi:hypothetical protein
MSMFACSICGVSVQLKPLYRNDPKGIPTDDWRCIKCLDEQYKPDAETIKLVDIISENSHES